MTLQIGDTAPDFEAMTTEGRIRFHEWIGNSWAVLFSHPKNFTPVCTTELGYMAKIKPEFDRRNVKIMGLSVDPVDQHAKWADDIENTQGFAPNYPMIGDPDLRISKAWGMLPAAANGDAAKRTASDNQTVRNVFVIGPDKKIKLILVYPMTTGRNFDEVLRVINSLQLTAKFKVATPVNWQHGEDVIIAGSVTDEAARKVYPQGWKAAAALHPHRAATARLSLHIAGFQRGRCRPRRRRALFPAHRAFVWRLGNDTDSSCHVGRGICLGSVSTARGRRPRTRCYRLLRRSNRQRANTWSRTR